MATTLSEMLLVRDDGDRAPKQGGVIEGSNPSQYNPKEPIVLFIIQVSTLDLFPEKPAGP